MNLHCFSSVSSVGIKSFEGLKLMSEKSTYHHEIENHVMGHDTESFSNFP